MYQDEAGFSRISKLGSCWSPIGVDPHVHSHYIREFRYCYGAVDAYTGESFFLIAGRCNTEWMNAFLEELSQAYPDGFKNKAFRILEDVMNQLQDVIQGLEKEVIKSIVNRRWTRMLFESR
ncbi:transposase family protein [Streptococcus pneumoniae]|nr:transposase family protein [Streptococcus pneumoniae]